MKLLYLLLIASCSSYFPPIRGQYTLTSLRHFMVSNLYVNPDNLQKEPGKISITYDVIIKNIDRSEHRLDLQKSHITVGKQSYPMSCYRYVEKDYEFTIPAGVQSRIVCNARIDTRGIAKSDYQSILKIPLAQEIAKFEYLIKAKDFE